LVSICCFSCPHRCRYHSLLLVLSSLPLPSSASSSCSCTVVVACDLVAAEFDLRVLLNFASCLLFTSSQSAGLRGRTFSIMERRWSVSAFVQLAVPACLTWRSRGDRWRCCSAERGFCVYVFYVLTSKIFKIFIRGGGGSS